MGNFIFEHLNFDILILFFADKLDKYFSNPNSNLLFAIHKKIRNQNISTDLQLKLFDSLVELIILYGS
jgi:hypothetical protein